MSTQTVELVSEWDSVPFDGGYEGLRALADQEFSGAVVTGPTRLFMLNGTVVGILDGDIEAFESGSGTAREAPHEALPLLAVMQARADEVRAKYYTQETPISDVDRTLSDGNFTGFVELSENVLSGDYYLVYHQGRSMSVAWVGSAERLVTDDEAFEQADDEVGIYEVKPAEISPIEIPAPSTETADQAGAADATGAVGASDVADDSTAPDDTTEPDEDPVDADQSAERDVAAPDRGAAEPDTDESAVDPGPGPAAGGPPGSKAAGANQGAAANRSKTVEPSDEETEQEQSQQSQQSQSRTRDDVSETADTSERSAETDQRQSTPTSTESAASSASPRQRTSDPEPTPQPDPDARERRSTVEQGARSETAPSNSASRDSGGDAVATTSDLETRSIPSLDPELSANSPDTSTTSDDAATVSSRDRPQQSQPAETQAQPTSTEPPTQTTEETAAQSPAPEAVANLEAELDGKEAEIARLESEIDDLETTNEDLRTERDRLQSDLEEARAEIERLEDRLAEARSDEGPSAGTRLSVPEAIDGTNLFVRYHSKGEATLAEAHDGNADPTQVEENLRLEYHTQFEASDATVDGTDFETFLQDSLHYRFVEWLIRNLLYEIRDTGHASAMQVLYDALPEIDRAELNGKVTVTYVEDGQEHRSQEQFDVVVRDRMGNPLLVANINDSRQPATEGQMTGIVRNAERVGNASDSLAAAFLVTSSFFEPEALETAEEATSSGLFSRDKRKSFVNLSRKDGYHLCLLEARNQEFHLAVPEL